MYNISTVCSKCTGVSRLRGEWQAMSLRMLSQSNRQPQSVSKRNISPIVMWRKKHPNSRFGDLCVVEIFYGWKIARMCPMDHIRQESREHYPFCLPDPHFPRAVDQNKYSSNHEPPFLLSSQDRLVLQTAIKGCHLIDYCPRGPSYGKICFAEL